MKILAPGEAHRDALKDEVPFLLWIPGYIAVLRRRTCVPNQCQSLTNPHRILWPYCNQIFEELNDFLCFYEWKFVNFQGSGVSPIHEKLLTAR